MRILAPLLTAARATWTGWSTRQRVHAVIVAISMCIAVGVQLPLSDWFIEDAAISFAYARNVANGEGLVTYVGGERVEGYSNPTWTFLLTLFEFVGINAFVAAKWLGGLFGAACIPLIYALTRSVRGHRKDDDAPAMAAVLLSMNAQFAIWNAAGLENSLFNLFLVIGLWRVLAEHEEDGVWRWPLSAFAFLGLAVTRPEGILYGALAGFTGMMLALSRDSRQGALYTAKWVFSFFLPFTLYHAVRYQYFGWAFPNTYYAKLGHKDFRPFSWSFRGWTYTRKWGWELWQMFFLPIYALAMTGLDKRRWIAWGVALVGLALVMYPGPDSWAQSALWPPIAPPSWWVQARVWGIVALMVALPLTALGRPAAAGRMLCWGSACITLFFAVYSTGDWMNGFRWFSLLAVPASVLFAIGVAELADLVQTTARSIDRPRLAVLGVILMGCGTVLATPPNVMHLDWFYGKRETGPFKVRMRVAYNTYLYRRLHLERPTVYDVDMGANMYWGQYDIVDMAGLVDVSMGHHHFERPFMQEYLWEERKPDLAHVHGGWARTSKIPSFPEWQERYIEAPGYPSSKKRVHIGNHVLRAHLMDEQWTGPEGVDVPFEDGLTLHGLLAPSPTTSPGSQLYVELGVSSRMRTNTEDYTAVVFLANDSGVAASWPASPAYDWIDAEDRREGEVFHGRYSFELPEDVPEGTYELGVVMFRGDKSVAGVLPPLPEEAEVEAPSENADSAPEGADAEDVGASDVPLVLPLYTLLADAELLLPEGYTAAGPRLARGEVRLTKTITVVSPEAHTESLMSTFDAVVQVADADRCAEAEEGWESARLPAYRRFAMLERERSRVGSHIASCLARQASSETDLDTQVDLLARAERWDRWSTDQDAAAEAILPKLESLGDAAVAAADWETAYTRFAQIMQIDPTQSHVRRKAELARDKRFGIDEDTLAQKEEERQERLKKARERQNKRHNNVNSRTDAELRRLKEAGRDGDTEADAPTPKPAIAVPVEPTPEASP